MPHLPPVLSLEEAISLVEDELAANEWHDVEVPKPTLEFVPYFIFHFDFFVESQDSEEGRKGARHVEESVEGVSALNAVTNKLEGEVADRLELEQVAEEYTHPKNVHVTIKQPRFEKEEVKPSVQIKIAAQEQVPRGHVHISGLMLVYFPFWRLTVDLDGETTSLRMDAVAGELEGAGEIIPFRGKTRGEVFKETLSDLRSAWNWVQYTRELFHDVWATLNPNAPNPANYWLIIYFLVAIILILLAIGLIPTS